MPKAKHTPGPWKFDKCGNISSEFNSHAGRMGYEIAKAYNTLDARLICAAPELFDALKALMAWSDHPALTGLPDGKPVASWAPSFDETVNMCHTALAKAEGRANV